MITLGITGLVGAGKGVAAKYLESRGFFYYSVRDFLATELRKRGISVNRDSLINLANELRSIYGPGYTAQIIPTGLDVVAESIRTEGEIIELKKREGFYLIAIIAEERIRFERIKKRNSETDHISFEEFLVFEKREATSNDPGVINLFRCIELADFKVDNNGALDDLYRRLRDVLLKIRPK
ncbi:hypothetical protein HY504_02630 [Candidatus Wolfebacteria bacterium]|nr:hypothetical protein [Candidatus Wolfebacteria bacterium]